MAWLRLLGVKPFTPDEMDALQCIRHLKASEQIDSQEVQEIVERLEWITGHPDIITYLQDNPWQTQAPKIILNDILAEVRLLNQLIDFQAPEEGGLSG